MAQISGNFFSPRPTGLCDVVDNSTSLSLEKVFRACGKMYREELSLIWGRRDEIGGTLISRRISLGKGQRFPILAVVFKIHCWPLRLHEVIGID